MAGNAPEYNKVDRFVHWVTAVLVIVAMIFGGGLYLLGVGNWPDGLAKTSFYNVHEWAGLTVIALTVFRYVWRAMRPVAPAPSMRPFDRSVSGLVHALIYPLMLLVPLTGWAMTSAYGFRLAWLGIIPIPALAPPEQPIGNWLWNVHLVVALMLIGLVLLHIAGVLMHHFVLRDGVASRMFANRR